jgi:hypothetical protein
VLRSLVAKSQAVARATPVRPVAKIASHPVYKDAGMGFPSICMGAGLRDYPYINAMVPILPMGYPIFSKAMGLPFFCSGKRRLMEKRTCINLPPHEPKGS